MALITLSLIILSNEVEQPCPDPRQARRRVIRLRVQGADSPDRPDGRHQSDRAD